MYPHMFASHGPRSPATVQLHTCTHACMHVQHTITWLLSLQSKLVSAIHELQAFYQQAVKRHVSEGTVKAKQQPQRLSWLAAQSARAAALSGVHLLFIDADAMLTEEGTVIPSVC